MSRKLQAVSGYPQVACVAAAIVAHGGLPHGKLMAAASHVLVSGLVDQWICGCLDAVLNKAAYCLHEARQLNVHRPGIAQLLSARMSQDSDRVRVPSSARRLMLLRFVI